MSESFAHPRDPQRPRVLCHLNHFYGESLTFRGKSTTQLADVRRAHVLSALAALREIGNIDIRVCGIPGRALVPIDIPFQIEDPRMLVYESLARMRQHLDEYDYFITIEDDIELPRETFENILAFDAQSELDACLHPNRLERHGERDLCVDLQAVEGWQSETRIFRGHPLRVATNPHSGLLILSHAKFAWAAARVDESFRGTVVGGPMASAFAHWLSPFQLWRSHLDWTFHFVRHLDNWAPNMMQPIERPHAVSDLKFTAILLSWKRPHNLPLLIGELQRIPEVREIILWNNDPEREISIPGVTVVNAPRNFRCLARYCMVPLAQHDNIWFQDDDLLVSPDQFRAVLAEYARDPGRIYGCCGRNLRDGKYVFADVWGEVDVVLGQTMMFQRQRLADAFAALGTLPPPTVEDDIVFSLLAARKPYAVNVGPLRDLGMSDANALHLLPSHAQKRQAAVDSILSFRRDHPHPERSRALIESQLAEARALLAQSEQHLAESRAAYDQLSNSISMRVVNRLKQLPLLYPAYRRIKGG